MPCGLMAVHTGISWSSRIIEKLKGRKVGAFYPILFRTNIYLAIGYIYSIDSNGAAMRLATEFWQGWMDSVRLSNFSKATKNRWTAAFGGVEIKRMQPKELQPNKTPYRSSCALYMIHAAVNLCRDQGMSVPKGVRRAANRQQQLCYEFVVAESGSPKKRTREEFIE